MYQYRQPIPSELVVALREALQPLIIRHGFSSHASFMSEVDETKALCVGLIPDLQTILPGPYGWFRLVGLQPSQQIVAHQDPPIQAERYHLPLQSNPGCWTFHGGGWQRLEIGSLYRMNPVEEHGAVNWGEILRVHLLIDVLDSPV